MEKILYVINPHRPRLLSIGFASRLAARTNSRLTGLFIENLFEKEKKDPGESYYATVPEEGQDTVVRTDTDHAITLFTRECSYHAISSETYVDKGEPIQLVLQESRYADVLVLDPDLSFYNDSTDQLPTHFVKEILSRAECPVILAPAKDVDIREIVFCYDGSASAVFAVKQATYLFPEFRAVNVLLLAVKKSENEDTSEDERRMMAWLQAHYTHVTYTALNGTTKDQLLTYFLRKEKKLVVLGAYGRTALSNFFRPSAADTLVRTVDLPLFITHFNR